MDKYIKDIIENFDSYSKDKQKRLIHTFGNIFEERVVSEPVKTASIDLSTEQPTIVDDSITNRKVASKSKTIKRNIK